MQTNNQIKPDEFQLGDTVWCVLYGSGKVISVCRPGHTNYPIEISFDNGGVELYTLCGRINLKANRTLFFSEPKIEASTTRPFVPTLVGKTVFVAGRGSTYGKKIEVKFEYSTIFGNDKNRFEKDSVEVYEINPTKLLE